MSKKIKLLTNHQPKKKANNFLPSVLSNQEKIPAKQKSNLTCDKLLE
jgi:hypothetical protein